MISTRQSNGLLRESQAEAISWRFSPARDFPRLADKWDALNALVGGLPFMQSEFIGPALEEFGDGNELLAICGQSDAPLAMAVMRKVRPGIWETFQPSQLPLGAFLMRTAAPFQEIVDRLVRDLPGFALSVAVTQQDPDIAPRPSESVALETLDYIDTARVIVADSFDRYWTSRGKNLRHNVKRQTAKLAEAGVSVQLDTIENPAQVASAIAEYGNLETAGWKAQQGTAVSGDNAQGRFYQKVFETFCHAHKGRIYRYRVGDRVAAMDLCLVNSGAMVILKTAYDESIKTISPANLMRYRYFQPIFDDERLSRVEFYGKVMEWHLRWTDQVRTLYHLNCYRWGWLKQVRDKLRRPRELREGSLRFFSAK